MNLLFIGIGGALGSIVRYGVFSLLKNFEHEHIRVGVFAVNIMGSFLIGIALALALKGIALERGTLWHFFFVTGFLGGFTTFSTFSQDNLEFLLLENNIFGFLVNIGANVFIGLFACFLGYFFVTKIFS